MKRRYWIGGVLLVMMLWGMMGCGRAEAPPAGQMVDGPGMMYTPEDQSPFAGSWQSRDGTIILEVESRGQFEASGIQVFVNGEPVWGDRIFEKCGIGRDEGGDGGKTLEIRGKRRLSARDGGANYQQS